MGEGNGEIINMIPHLLETDRPRAVEILARDVLNWLEKQNDEEMTKSFLEFGRGKDSIPDPVPAAVLVNALQPRHQLDHDELMRFLGKKIAEKCWELLSEKLGDTQ